ncbi:SMC5-SMC6 complex localization factor protein 2 [Trichomycterus rosablanca]|uniref:SMC5-SMC6 complex localization factor protein 2 n=1 Tax=Trichomycterus rosablanca TaxID=2290929 RepID=UPI002F351CC7
MRTVNDKLPLGVSRRYSADETRTTHPVPRRLSQETEKKHLHTLKSFNSLPKHMLPQTNPVLERRNRPTEALPIFSKKLSSGGQNSIFIDESHQSAAKKDALLQKPSSYHKQREFALAFSKQLNDHLKVERAVTHSGKSQHQKPPGCPVSGSYSSPASQNSQRGRKSPNSVDQQGQQSVEKMDNLLNGDHNISVLSPVSSRVGELEPQAYTPGSKCLSLKRRREFSGERRMESKRLCQEDVEDMPISISSSSSSGSSVISSPPKYIRRAFLKNSTNSVLTIKEKPSPTQNSHSEQTKTSNIICKELFKDPSREPKSESQRLKTEAPSAKVLGTSQVKEEMGKFSESESPGVSTHLPHPCSSPYNNNSYSDGGSTTSSHFSSSPGFMDTSSPKPFKHTQLGSPGSKKSEGQTKKHDPMPTPKARHDDEKKKCLVWKDPFDLDEDVDDCALSLSSSTSTEEEQLLSLKEILERSSRVPDTPDKMAFSEPSTPLTKVSPEDLKTKAVTYKNTLDQMLKEKEQNQKSKELEMQLLQTCKEDLLKLDEENESAEDLLSHEQREFLQKFSVTSCAIRDIHPGEEMFMLTNFGRLFNHESLDLRKLGVIPNNIAQQTLLQARSDQLLLLLSAGLFRRAYLSSPCQRQVTHWLFQMMSVHPNPVISAQILLSMTTIALSAAQQIVEKHSKKFEVWVPSIKDVALVFLNMGVSFVNLFPYEALQPPFTEGDLLESSEIQPDDARGEKEGVSFPEHNFENVVKYLALCAALCPRAYTDEELLLLLTVICRVSLETRLQLMPTGDLTRLLHHILNNLSDWETQLPEVCQAITDLSEDHHNLRWLVLLLPHSGKGKQLRRHLSVAIISKLLNQRCTYKPSCLEFQLSDLRIYLPRMRPSLLLKNFMTVKTTDPQDAEDCATTPDQQAYYLCYSLLALTNEASNFEFLPSKQRNELRLLSAELEKHIKCDIRESEKMLYRSKVKDFVARIYTKWQVLLQRSRPEEGKLYDYWKPLPEDEIPIEEEGLSTESPKRTATQVHQSENFNDVLSEEEEERMEEKGDVSVGSKEEPEDRARDNQEKNEGLQETSENEVENEGPDKYEGQLDDQLGESSKEGDVDNELVERNEELLPDNEPLDRNVDLVGGENEYETLGFLSEDTDIIE